MARRDTYISGPHSTRYPGTTDPKAEAAQLLRLVAGRYLSERANARDVDDAISIWRAASVPLGARSPDAPPTPSGTEHRDDGQGFRIPGSES